MPGNRSTIWFNNGPARFSSRTRDTSASAPLTAARTFRRRSGARPAGDSTELSACMFSFGSQAPPRGACGIHRRAEAPAGAPGIEDDERCVTRRRAPALFPRLRCAEELITPQTAAARIPDRLRREQEPRRAPGHRLLVADLQH